MPVLTWNLTVADVVAETADAVTIVFDPLASECLYLPGQFLTLRVPSERTGFVARCYSLSSSPSTDDHLAVTVKRTADGYASNWLCDNVSVGDQIQCLPPNGVFTPTKVDGDLLLLAAGSGITPMLSIAKSALAGPGGRIVLVYANRDAESVIFAAALRDLVDEHPDRITVIHWLEAVQGLPRQATLAALLEPFHAFDVFICGPTPFMKAARHALEGFGTPRARIHIENFVSLSGDPFTEPDISDAAAVDVTTNDPANDAEARCVVTVTLDGQRYELPRSPTRTLIDLLIENAIDAPYSCREGDCGTCQCVLVSGRVDMDSHGALDEEDIADGIVLGCQARPASDTVEIEF
ncbi:ferredoxin--NADP reductase [Mycolicibacterium hodleri]|uniref:Ferredoxin--NADP reductase n=1 Tax=Mycolicibacterium hodleri TaxID=49897 RepID=A0A502EG00_9MYCO|nr:ferredoxin--NADP reductase [Mycolicibacterium hodleri]TPG36653.1 ferredoxin--NADP reductase [Mycolicibacterium hodleri]